MRFVNAEPQRQGLALSWVKWEPISKTFFENRFAGDFIQSEFQGIHVFSK